MNILFVFLLACSSLTYKEKNLINMIQDIQANEKDMLDKVDLCKELDKALVLSLKHNYLYLAKAIILKLDREVALFILIDFENLELLEYFYNIHKDIIDDTYGKNEETALIYASRKNKRKVIKFLLSKYANVNKKDKEGETAIYLFVLDLLSKKDDEYKEGIIILKMLLSEDYSHDIEKYKLDMLGYVAQDGDEEIMELLIKQGISINDPNENTPLSIACLSNKVSMVKFLIANGAKINSSEIYAFSNPIITKILIDAGANPNERNRVGRTPLMEATSGEVVAVLLDSGADPYLESNSGTTVAISNMFDESLDGVFNRYILKINTLVNKGFDINRGNKAGLTALMYASKNRYERYVSFLLNLSNPNTRDKQNKTALMHSLDYKCSTFKFQTITITETPLIGTLYKFLENEEYNYLDSIHLFKALNNTLDKNALILYIKKLKEYYMNYNNPVAKKLKLESNSKCYKLILAVNQLHSPLRFIDIDVRSNYIDLILEITKYLNVELKELNYLKLFNSSSRDIVYSISCYF